jgi:hypothetical protein
MKTAASSIAFLFFLLVIWGCENPASDDEKNGGASNSDYAKLTFENKTQFHVEIHRDAFSGSLLCDELAPGASITVDVMPSDNYGVGSTFCYTYRLGLGEKNDAYSALAFADGVTGSDPDMQENFVAEKGRSYTKEIKVPYQIDCNAAYIRIRNKTSGHFELSYISESQKQLGNEEVPVPAGKTGIYKVGHNRFTSPGYKIISVFQEYVLPPIQMEKNYVYDYIFTETDLGYQPILYAKWKIRGEAADTWLKTALACDSGAFNNTQLNNHLASDLRYGLSDKRSNYPGGRIIAHADRLVSGSMGFNYFDDAKPYEMPVLIARDAKWETSVFPPSYGYAGSSETAYHTMFNDCAVLQDNTYVVLASYVKGSRSGMWLFYFNANGQFLDELDIPAASNGKESLMGIHLYATSDGGFLVLGGKKIYANSTAANFTSARGIVYKYVNKTRQWGREYIESGYPVTFAINGTETNNGYLVCAIADNDVNVHTRLLKLNKSDGAITSLASLARSSENVAPHSIVCDADGNSYVTGILSHGQYVKAYIWKLNTTGSQIWLKEYGPDAADNFLFDMIVQDNTLVAAGSRNSNGANPDYYKWQYGSGWLLKIDTGTGTVLQDMLYTGVSSLNSVVPLNDGGYVFSAIKNIDTSHAYKFNVLALKVNEHLELR